MRIVMATAGPGHSSLGFNPSEADDGYSEPNAAIIQHQLVEGDVIHFHTYGSEHVVYEEPKKQAKIIGGKYLKGEMLGEGSYSKVKEVLDCVSLCRRAVKIMKKKRLRWKIYNGEANVQREIEILKRLKHRNVIELVEVFEDDEKQKLYVVLEYCVGGLQEMLDKTPGNKFPIYQSHKYFVQLIDGLEYLHSKGIVHKDIKPGNLLLTTDEVVKITDFGVSEELDVHSRLDTCTVHQGTHTYQPPEVASGQETFQGFKADIWSAGVTLYQFTTGKFPFEGENVYKLLQVIAIGNYVLPPDLPPLVQDLIKGMLFKDVEMRLSIPDIKRHLWVVTKHGKPLLEQMATFAPYPGTDDPFRGTTVLPYLESFYNYGVSEGGQEGMGAGQTDTQRTDEALLESIDEATSLRSHDQPLTRNKPPLPSQGNVLFPTSTPPPSKSNTKNKEPLRKSRANSLK